MMVLSLKEFSRDLNICGPEGSEAWFSSQAGSPFELVWFG
jgi:hypothetical protein